MSNNLFEEQYTKFNQAWKEQTQKLQAQFSEAKMDPIASFEQQKEFFKGNLESWKKSLDESRNVSEEKMKELKAKFEALQVQLSLGKAEGAEFFEAQAKQIQHAMEELYEAGKSTGDHAYEQTMNLFDQQAKAFKTAMEISKLQFSLATMEGKEGVEELKAQMQEKVGELSKVWEEGQQMAAKNFEMFQEQAKAGFEKFQSWSTAWMDKFKNQA